MFSQINNLSPFEHPVDEHGNILDVVVCDPFEGQEFNKSGNGFPKSLIEQIMTAESQKLKEALIKQLVDAPTGSLPADMSTADAIATIVPKYINTAASFRDWLGEANDTPLAKSIDQFKAKLEAAKSKPDVGLNPVNPIDKQIVDAV